LRFSGHRSGNALDSRAHKNKAVPAEGPADETETTGSADPVDALLGDDETTNIARAAAGATWST